MNWKEAWNASEGPQSRQEQLWLMLKGACMGTADIIPGVSGGTIAFITGIYESLLAAIASFNTRTIQLFLKGQWKAFVAETHLRFLIPLFFGIAVAIVSTARLMHFLIKDYPVFTWSLFFGLIAASIVFVAKAIQEWNPMTFIAMAIGTAIAWMIVGLIPVETTNAWWFLFLSGVIAISAMILPGLSGSFLLLILGKYELITGAIKNPVDPANLTIIVVFSAGCLVGLLGFSRVVKYFLTHHHNVTMALLTGVMIGAMRKVWPWKEVLETVTIRGKERVLRDANILPELNPEFAIAGSIMLLGFILVMLMGRLGEQKSP